MHRLLCKLAFEVVPGEPVHCSLGSAPPSRRHAYTTLPLETPADYCSVTIVSGAADESHNRGARVPVPTPSAAMDSFLVTLLF
jgi:hypothetical protein